MNLPKLTGVIDRRILINYRVNTSILQNLLPPPFRPKIINGYGSAGICLLRLKDIGLSFTPSFLKINSENAAHRILVEWEADGETFSGVYIPRRDTDSILNVVMAGKIFSWPHYFANFAVEEKDNFYSVNMLSEDNSSKIIIKAKHSSSFPSNSMFSSIEEASACFKSCALGYSPSLNQKELKGIELKTKSWSVEPLEVEEVFSSFFDDSSIFPDGSVQFDNALLMKNIDHEWNSKGMRSFKASPSVQEKDLILK